MREQNRIINIVNSKFYPLLLFVVSFVFVTLFSRATSFLYVFEGGDPAIFKQMGLALLRGKILYVDYFDNKGCILYFIQALGLWLGGNFFILLMQALSLTVTLLIWDKMLALYRNERGRLICLGIALVLLLCFYQDGDLTEEWCLPFASYPLLVYFRALKSGKDIRPITMFTIGICFGIIAFIRINNAVSFLGFVAYLWIQYLLHKDFKNFFKSLGFFILGSLIITGVCVFYFYIKAGEYGVSEMIYATFLSNFDYIDSKVKKKIFLCVFYFLFLALCIIQQIINSIKDKNTLIPALISYGLFAITFGSRCFTHYLMALLPLIIILLMTINYQIHQKQNIITLSLAVVATFFYLPIPIALTVNDLILKNDKYSVIYEDFHHCIEKIPIKERDSICNYNLLGNGSGLLFHEGLIQSNRLCFSNVAIKMPSLWKKNVEQVNDPKWILLSWNRKYSENDATFILKFYDLYCDFPFDRVYLKKPKIGKNIHVYLYRRKDNFHELLDLELNKNKDEKQ